MNQQDDKQGPHAVALLSLAEKMKLTVRGGESMGAGSFDGSQAVKERAIKGLKGIGENNRGSLKANATPKWCSCGNNCTNKQQCPWDE